MITITEELVANVKVGMLDPKAAGRPQRPLSEIFTPADEVTAKHVLAGCLKAYDYPRMPKLLIYIIMDEIYGVAKDKDKSGAAGYHLQYNQQP